MRIVSFISLESGADFLIGMALVGHDDSTEIETLTLLRSPQYEHIFDEHERGIKVDVEPFSIEGDLLQSVDFDKDEQVLRLTSQQRQFELDVRRVERSELKAMWKLLRKMNFDGRVQMPNQM